MFFLRSQRYTHIQLSKWLRLLFITLFSLSVIEMLPRYKSTADLDIIRTVRVPFQPEVLPLMFVANTSQSPDNVEFLVKDAGKKISFTDDAVVFSPMNSPVDTGSIRLQFLSANKTPSISGQHRQSAVINYFQGDDPNRWQSNVPTYGGIVYRELYPGIDLVYDGMEGNLKSEFHVEAGTNPDVIRMKYTGVDSLKLGINGELILEAGYTKLIESAPVVYQTIGDRQVMVDAHYRFWRNDIIGFEVADYNPSYPLIIDPVIEYSTYFGGSNFERASGMAIDSEGSIYITGRTVSNDFPTANALQPDIGGGVNGDAFVAKFSSDSTLIYATYLGGSSSDLAYDIAVDSSGSAYVTGETLSEDFPVVNAFQSACATVCSVDVFVAKLAPDGSALLYSTYLGGTNIEGGSGIAVDANGNAYVTGQTASVDFPTQNPIQPAKAGVGTGDAFITKFTTDGTALVYSTYLGGNAAENVNFNGDIAVDGDGNAYVTGETRSTDFPLLNPIQETMGGGRSDAFVAKVNAEGSALVYSTYLGGSGDENVQHAGIAVDIANNVYIVGATESEDFPTLNPFQPDYGGGPSGDAFVAKLNEAGTSLVYSTYLGGNNSDVAQAVVVDENGNVYLTGTTSSSDFPLANAFQLSRGGIADAFITKFSADGATLMFSSYLGGGGSENLGWPLGAIALDTDGAIYVAGGTNSDDFPVVNALQPNAGGLGDAFVTKIVEAQQLYLPIIVNR